MQIDYDPEADAVYIRLRDGEVAQTVESSKYIYVDVDASGVPLGIEILFAKNMLGARDMTSITFNVAAGSSSELTTARP
ncbi:MAG: DUF2283 domain-containing protein [Caldilineaceae bacterium]|jgi:uncharacterized protein YuzE|uniref:DUF2283 domain-containing protein n=1 Tax=Caldilinea sp. TaxID=2293560 RepID=UPI0019F51BFE|nr:DUF2283 domain-containing protein [Caldilineaceae bacterium]MBK8799399.1 DUF2283 domain-containing protein [Anaerolineales bacterium]HQY90935.1 DUF2283 domain-containing protein [Caldilinea sp.]HRA64543.1 DUF2283 domain-containing protein [Caldilinea sp.]